jgi:hypothetical protein
MRFMDSSGTINRHKSMMGFTQVFIMLIAVVLMAVGIFDYVNPEMFGFGNASIVMIVIGGMMLVVGFMISLTQMYHFSDMYAWIGSFFVVVTLAVLILLVSIFFEGGVMNG